MKNRMGCQLAVCLCAGGLGSVAVADETPVTLEPSRGRVVDVAHIYFNLATGERVITLIGDGQTAPAATETSLPIWSSRVNNQCQDAGYTSEMFFAFDNNAGTTSLATDITVSDFGDIEMDSVVDCVHIDWVTDHDDTDLDSDGVGDGVIGLSGQWTWWDVDNGRSSVCCRAPIVSFTLFDLPGDISGTTDPDDPQNEFGKYSADIDLAGSFGDSLTFEIGDSDGDGQGAAFFNPLVALHEPDLDGDGLFDWGWSVRFAQPGTRDIDGDGVIDGDPADGFKSIGISFGSGAGTSIDNGDGTWTWDRETTGDAATGQEDAFAIYSPPQGPGGDILHAGFFWFGGYRCTGVPVNEIDPNTGEFDLGYTPTADFEHQLFEPNGVIIDICFADLNEDFALNFFDVAIFLEWFGNGDLRADFTGDGILNFFDVSIFLSFFAQGCP
ncbi:MAG: hypothetical protein JKX70_11400 [Phycisphaerales bacterium]|nr:hypothetical protein [Phycisphaerales bacterium]